MSTITKPRINLFAPFMQIFASGEDIEIIDESEFNKEQQASQAKSDEIMSKSRGSITESSGQTNKKGGFAKKINPNTEAMREMYNRIVQSKSPQSPQDREIE